MLSLSRALLENFLPCFTKLTDFNSKKIYLNKQIIRLNPILIDDYPNQVQAIIIQLILSFLWALLHPIKLYNYITFKIKLMDAVNQAEETLDIGVCSEHNRVFQCYCNICYCMICPSCLMFDSHKGHTVSKIEEGAKQLRNQINNSAKQGFLKFDRTQNVLLDIRHVKLSLEENQQKITKDAEDNFDELIAVLKGRKNKFLKEIKEHFNGELQKIQDQEAQWVRKQELSQKILHLQTSNDDIKLIQEAKQIVQGLDNLKKALEYRQIKLIESVKTESSVGKSQTGFNQVKQILKNYMSIGNPIINKLKC